ncbi:MAG: hypothetical protein LC732_07325 [Acidobacteria bacterium]|nr:hypothetical protein [Acidobacteriota bacterium]
MNRIALLFLLLSFLLANPAAAQELVLDLEGAAAWQLRNDFAVPGDEGTLVRLADDGPAPAGRATLTWHRWERWSLRVVAAPYSSDAVFVSSGPVRFEDVVFPAGEPIEVDYRFNSWRAGAFYRFAPRGDWSLRAGITLKVRDAEIALRSGEQEASNENIGLVPLLYGGARWERGRRAFDIDVDGAAASQGRAIDLALRGEQRISDRASLFLGARILDGGADNEEVFAFATVLYATGGIRVTW